MTIDGLSPVSGLGPSAVTKEDIEKFYGGSIDDDLLTKLLDMGIHGKRPGLQTRDTADNDSWRFAVGLRKALAEKIDQLAQGWSTMAEKIHTVLWLSLRKAYRVLEKGGSDAIALRGAMSCIFSDESEQRPLEHFFAQLSGLLNDWSDSKRICKACTNKKEHASTYGYDASIPSTWILRRVGGKHNRRTRSSGKQLDNGVVPFKVGDVLLRQIDPKTQKPMEPTDGFLQVVKIWDSESNSPISKDKPKGCLPKEMGFLPKEMVELLFGHCNCLEWNTKWRPFTHIVECYKERGSRVA